MKKSITLVAILYDVQKLEVGMFLHSENKERSVHQFNQRDYDDRERYADYRYNWKPIKLYGVCDESLKEGDKFLSGNVGNPELAFKVFTFCGNYKNDLVKIKNEEENMFTSTKFLMEGIKKVIICPEQIGLKRCWSSDIREDNGWEEALDSDDIQDILSNNGKCWVEVDGDGKIKLQGNSAFISLTE